LFHLNRCILQSGIYMLIIYFAYILIAHTFIFVAFWLSIATQEPWTHINLGSPLMKITPSTIFDPFKTLSCTLSFSCKQMLKPLQYGCDFLALLFCFYPNVDEYLGEQSIMNEHNRSLGVWTCTILRLFEKHFH
jgi:hypothetical protein